MIIEPASEAARDVAQDGLAGIRSILEYKLPSIGGLTIDVGQVVGLLLVILLTWVAAIVTRRMFKRYGERYPNTNHASLYTVSRLVQYVVLVIGVLVALKTIGVSMGQFAVVAGALGVGLGFGLKEIFSNFISGLILLFDKSLKVGDFVELESGVHGEVRDIKIRATTVVTNDNIDILVPNSEFVSGRVVNWTHREVSRRLRIPFGVAYGTDKESVKRAALEAAAEVPFTLDLEGPRRPQVWLVEFGDSSLNYDLVVWLTAEATKRPSTVKAAYNWALHTALQKYDIEIPFPQQDVHVRSLFGLAGKSALHALRLDDGQASSARDKRVDDAAARNDAIEEVQERIREDEARAMAEAEARAKAETEATRPKSGGKGKDAESGQPKR